MIITRNTPVAYVGRGLLARRESAARLLALPLPGQRRTHPIAIRRTSGATVPENETMPQSRVRSHDAARELLGLIKAGILRRADRALSAQGNGLPRDVLSHMRKERRK